MAGTLTRVALSDAAKQRIADRLPAGYNPDNVRFLRASGTLVTSDDFTPIERAMAEEVERSGGVPLITDGKPTIMRVVAWMAHEGINRNRLAFEKADLEKAAAKIKAPDLLPMDFNHSAVDPWSWDERVIGAWYKADFKLDPKAKGGQGAYGILATGMVWSALFQKYSTKLLAEQMRYGKIDFSMACIPQSVTFTDDADGPYEIAHDPVFFTLSALDVPPGDVDAIGKGVEGSDDPNLEATLTEELAPLVSQPEPNAAELATLTTALHALFARAAAKTEPARPDPAAQNPEAGMEQLLEALKAELAKIADKDTVTALDSKVKAIADAVQAQTDDATKLTEAETQLAASKSALETANGTIKDLNAAVAARDAELKVFKDAAEKDSKAAKLVERKKQLPPAYLEAHAKLEEGKRSAVEVKWAAKSDDEWTEFVEALELMPKVEKSFLRRSQEEGALLGGGGQAGDGTNLRSKYLD